MWSIIDSHTQQQIRERQHDDVMIIIIIGETTRGRVWQRAVLLLCIYRDRVESSCLCVCGGFLLLLVWEAVWCGPLLFLVAAACAALAQICALLLPGPCCLSSLSLAPPAAAEQAKIWVWSKFKQFIIIYRLMEDCRICGSAQWEDSQGALTCLVCGTQSQDYLEESFDVDVIFWFENVHTSCKKSTIPSEFRITKCLSHGCVANLEQRRDWCALFIWFLSYLYLTDCFCLIKSP